MRRYLIVLGLFIAPVIVSARLYDTSHLEMYSDAPTDPAEAIAISVLTDAQIVHGNPDGTFRSDALLNRAEFLKIAMGLREPVVMEFSLACFPDVPANAWYAYYVCLAKNLGIVEGNAIPDLDPVQWPFEPERNVLYVEALKILSETYNVALKESSGEWYMPYLLSALENDTALPEGPAVDHFLTRGEMARLVVRFMAFHDGELNDLHSAQLELMPSGTGSLTGSGVTTGSGATASGSTSSSGDEPLDDDTDTTDTGTGSTTNTGALLLDQYNLPQYDPDSDDSTDSALLLLGSTSPVLASASVFSELQPIVVNDIIIRLSSSVQSIESMIVYDHDGKLLGIAYLDHTFPGGRQYVLPIKPAALTIPKELDYSFYVRARLKPYDSGGVSGEFVRVEKIGVQGDGGYNNKSVSAYSGDDFSDFQTARSVITSIENSSSANDILIAGLQVRLGSFRFKGEVGTGDGSADLEVTKLVFQADQAGGVTLSNVRLSADGTSEKMNCSIAGTQITCSDIAPEFGSLEDIPRTITLYGDVAISSGASRASLQLRINEPGRPLSPGDLRWTDGSTDFRWVPGYAPLVRSTAFEL